MIKLKLSFGKQETETSFEVEDRELLKAAVERATKEVPLGEFKLEDVFNVVVNGHIIDHAFWSNISLKKEDNVLITPKIKDGEFGQIFAQIVVIAAIAVVSFYFPPAAALGNALLVAGVAIGTTLAMHALIPPPVPELGGGGAETGGGGVEESQMYAITGQSNQMKRLGVVPKVYGSHRMFPTLAANPYTELSVDPSTGEIIQYLCGIYDFGLGTPQISDMKIGDTPLTTDSFKDFQFRLVDPNKPTSGQDQFDEPLESEFKLYKGDRSTAQLSFALEDGTEVIQNTANNSGNLPQEIILDFVCPRGLYGYSSGGQIGGRRVNLQIEFAPVGSSDWKPYNDITAVDNYNIVGGTEVTSFRYPVVPIVPSGPGFSSYYQGFGNSDRNYNNQNNYTFTAYLRIGGTKLLLPNPSGGEDWQVGHEISVGDQFLGIIQSVVPSGGNFEITLDRPIGVFVRAFDWQGNVTYGPMGETVPIYNGSAMNVTSAQSTFNEPATAAISAGKQSAVYASFRFTPKALGQFKIRVRRVSTQGDYTQQVADDVTWAGLTTAFSRLPINTDKRHVFMELKVRATNQLNGNIQNLSAVCTQPLYVYDPDTLTWAREITNNPAWVFVDLLTGEVNKKAVPRERLHMESILAWADYCAEVPTPPPSQTYLWPRFSCNFLMDYETTLQQVLQQVGGAAQASLNIIDGKYGVLVDRLKVTPVQVFTPRNSRDFSSTRFYSNKPHGVKVKYIDPQLGWEVSEVIVYDNGYNEDNATELDELTSFACTSFEQAWRFGRYMIAQNKLRQETMNILVDFENLICTRGDYVQISQDVMQVGGRPARVKAINGSEITIDDALDIDPDLDYGYVHRAADGEIITSSLTPITSRTFALTGDKIVFRGQNTTGQVMDLFYRYGGAPPAIGTTVKQKAVAGVFSAGNTDYTLSDTPLSDQHIRVWLNGNYRTDWTLIGNVVRFTGQDTTGQVFDTQYSKTGSLSSGSPRRLNAMVGVFSAGDTVYTLPEAPLSDDDTLGWLDGVMRTDFVLSGNTITFVGQNTTGQDFDTHYRYAGGSSPVGLSKNVNALTGVWDGTDTTYTLPDPPLSDYDVVAHLNGIMRTDYDRDLEMPEVGDLIVIGEIGKVVFDCIVKSISPNDDLSAQISLVERANEIFDYESQSELPEYDPQFSNTSRPDFAPPRPVVALALSSNTWECAETQSGYNYYAEITWDIPPGSVYEFFEIWANDGRGYKLVTNTSARYFKYNVDQARLGSEHGLKVVAVASSGKKIQLIQMPEVLFTPVVKSEPPSDVANFGMSITNQTLQLTWAAIDDCDVNKYEVRYSPDVNDVWEASVQLQIVDRNVNSLTVQARTGVYFIKAIDFAGNKSVNAVRTITTIPNLFDLNVIETFNDAPTFPGEFDQTEKLGEAVILREQVSGDVDSMSYFPEGFYQVFDLLDLGDIYSVRLASYIRADGYRFGELMSSWEHLSEVDHLSTSSGEDWNVLAEYRATNEILSMADWAHLYDIEHINEGLGSGFTDWRPIPTIGDATGRVFQFRVRLESLTPNVTPRLFDGTIKADMPDRVDSFENLVSDDTDPYQVTYEKRFRGPAPSPNVQITIDNGQTGDYWVFENKNLEGFQIRFYDKNDVQVIRTFDVQAKGYGSRHTVTI